MTITTDYPVVVGKDPRTLVSEEVFGKLSRHFAASQEVTQGYAERATGQFLLMLKAHAAAQLDPQFGMSLPDGRTYRVVPTGPVDAVWHAVIQHSEPYTAACEQIAGGYVHHVPILTEGMRDGTAIEYTRKALRATGYAVDPEFWVGEAESCCPPNPGT